MPRLHLEGNNLSLVASDGKVTHSHLQAQIVEVCNEYGLHVHACDMRRSRAGFPDLVILGARGVLWREIKIPPDELSSAQKQVKYTLIAARMNWAVWTPDDLANGTIHLQLEGIAA